MAKGASIKFKSYEESVPKLLAVMNLGKELKKYDKIVIKPYVDPEHASTSVPFLSSVLKFCLNEKNPVAEVFIAEGLDGLNTLDVFAELGYGRLAEQFPVSLIDLNESDTEEVSSDRFLKFPSIHYPRLLKESFVISIGPLAEHEEAFVAGSLVSMVGAFPSQHYSGFFSQKKTKIKKWPVEYAVHDITKVKMPDLAIIDASGQDLILAGLPLEVDKQAAKLLGKEWERVPYIKLIDASSEENGDGHSS